MSADTLTMPEACERLGISEWLGYRLARDGEFPVPVLRLGRTIRISKAALAFALSEASDP